MGYLERSVIGVLILISAYSLYEGAQHRQHFHNTITHLLTCLKLEHCYPCIENLRLGFAALVFTAGVTLVFDLSIVTGILVELLLVTLQVFKIKDCQCVCASQTLLVHLLLLIVLINNWRSNRASLEREEKEDKAPKESSNEHVPSEQPKQRQGKADHEEKSHRHHKKKK